MPYLNTLAELRHTGVVKNYQRVTSGAAGVPQSAETDASTRQRVASSILEHGLTPAGIRRHLDVLLATGHV